MKKSVYLQKIKIKILCKQKSQLIKRELQRKQ